MDKNLIEKKANFSGHSASKIRERISGMHLQLRGSVFKARLEILDSNPIVVSNAFFFLS